MPAATADLLAACDYLSVRALCDHLATLPPDTLVNLHAPSARPMLGALNSAGYWMMYTLREAVCLMRGEEDEIAQRWNALDFGGERPWSTAAQLLAVLEPHVATHGHASVMRNGKPLELPGAVCMLQDSRRYNNETLLSPNFADALLSRVAPGDAHRAHAVLTARFGRRTADGAEFFAVDGLWFNAGKLLKRYPLLRQQSGWLRLFPPCGVGALRRCVVGDAPMLAEFATVGSPVERLLNVVDCLRNVAACQKCDARSDAHTPPDAPVADIPPDAPVADTSPDAPVADLRAACGDGGAAPLLAACHRLLGGYAEPRADTGHAEPRADTGHAAPDALLARRGSAGIVPAPLPAPAAEPSSPTPPQPVPVPRPTDDAAPQAPVGGERCVCRCGHHQAVADRA